MQRHYRLCCCWNERRGGRPAGSTMSGALCFGNCPSQEVWHLTRDYYLHGLFGPMQLYFSLMCLHLQVPRYPQRTNAHMHVYNLYMFCWTLSMHAVKEEGVHEVFADHKFYYPVKVTIEQSAPLEDFPWIRPSDFVKTLHKTNDLPHLLGGYNLKDAKPVLRSFWENTSLLSRSINCGTIWVLLERTGPSVYQYSCMGMRVPLSSVAGF